jgi:hypothetical protein
MPPPPALAPPYDLVDSAMDLARTRLNDAIQQSGGDILKNSQNFSITMCNAAWRRLQHYLANLGYSRLIDEVVITELPICASSDPAAQCWLDWTGFFDGTKVWTNYALPQKCSFPLKIWDRVSGFNAGWGCHMEQVMDGLPATCKYQRNAMFDWRNDRIYMPGTNQPVDMRVRFGQYLPSFQTQGETKWFQQPIPIVGAVDALADYICVEASDGRDDIDSQTFKGRAEGEAKLLFNADVRIKNRSNVRRIPRSGPRNREYGYANS